MEKDNYKLAGVVAALVSTLVSIILFVAKNYYDKKMLRTKLETEFEFEEKKKIKEFISAHKIPLIYACEDLRLRINNLTRNFKKERILVNGAYSSEDNYFHSFVYKFLSVYGWIKIIRNTMVYLDSTLASDRDLNYIKILTIMPHLFFNRTHIEGSAPLEPGHPDSFDTAYFHDLPDYVIEDNKVISYRRYLEKTKENDSILQRLYIFLDGINPVEERTRWDRLNLLELTLMIILNSYGFDFMHSSKSQLYQTMNTPRTTTFLPHYANFLVKYKLNSNEDVRNVIQLISQLKTA